MVTMNIVITGGSGFVGSYLCEKLINDGHKIIVIDNLLTGSTENINDLLDNENFSFIERDVQDHIEIEDKVDYVCLLYTSPSPRDSCASRMPSSA